MLNPNRNKPEMMVSHGFDIKPPINRRKPPPIKIMAKIKAGCVNSQPSISCRFNCTISSNVEILKSHTAKGRAAFIGFMIY